MPVIPALFRCYAGFIPLIFPCYSPAILLLFSCYSPAILLLFWLYSGFILLCPCFMRGFMPYETPAVISAVSAWWCTLGGGAALQRIREGAEVCLAAACPATATDAEGCGASEASRRREANRRRTGGEPEANRRRTGGEPEANRRRSDGASPVQPPFESFWPL